MLDHKACCHGCKKQSKGAGAFCHHKMGLGLQHTLRVCERDVGGRKVVRVVHQRRQQQGSPARDNKRLHPLHLFPGLQAGLP